MKRIVVTLLVLVMLLSGSLPAWATDGTDTSPALTHFKNLKAKLDVTDAKKPNDPALKKLSSGLLPLADEGFLPEGVTMVQYQSQMDELGSIKLDKGFASGKSADAEKSLTYVYVKVREDSDLSRIEPYAERIDNRKDTLAAAWVKAENLQVLAALDCVVSIIEVTAPIVEKFDASEGVGLHKADLAQKLSTGKGVKIGIISDGVDHLLDAVASGDLPGNVQVLSNAHGGDEGTAMLEIVYDMAPGAQLYFHDSGTNTLAFNEAVDALIAAGCTIVCDDIGWITEPFYQDGVIASHFKEIAAQNKVLFVSSAGNSADKHYQGAYMESADYGNGWHDFSHGTSDKEDILVRLNPGSVLKAVLQWNEPFEAANLSDYDLYFIDPYSGNFIVSSKDDNLATHEPLEFLTYANSGSSPMYIYVSVKRYNAPIPKELELFIYGAAVEPDNVVKADSIFGHPAVPNVIACGAINAVNPGTPPTIEDFSSQGPVTMLNGTRNKPDVCGADGVDVTGVGGFDDPFSGTSAAAPHVAAIAALIKARFPQYTPAQIRSVITKSCTDLGATGYDTKYGYGLLNAYAAVTSSYYVKFNSQSGSAVPTQLVARGAKIATPPSTTRTGYTFGGWYKDTALKTAWNFAIDKVSADITLYAKWTASTRTVTFNSQGGSSVTMVAVPINGLLPKPANPTRTGYTFVGWYKDSACTTAWNFTTDKVTTNITLYAKWAVVKYTIALQTNSTSYGTVSGGGSIAYGTLATVKAVPKAGYLFVYWLEGSTAVSTSAEYKFTVSRSRTLKAEFAKIGTIVNIKAVSASYNSVKLTWGAVAGASGYEIYRATSSTGTYCMVTTIASGTTVSYTNNSLNTGTTYYYKARAYRLVGSNKVYNDYSAVVSAKPVPATPASVKAASASYNSAKLTWGAVTGASGYEIYRATSSAGTYGKVTTITSGTTVAYTNTSLTTGTTYYYKMRAYRLVGSTKVYGGYSAVISAKPVPSAPAGVKAARVSSTSIKVSWNAVTGSTGYEVYRATTSSGTYTLMKSVTTLNWTNTGLSTGTTFYYKVRVYRTVGSTRVYGGYGAVVSAKP